MGTTLMLDEVQDELNRKKAELLVISRRWEEARNSINPLYERKVDLEGDVRTLENVLSRYRLGPVLATPEEGPPTRTIVPDESFMGITSAHVLEPRSGD